MNKYGGDLLFKCNFNQADAKPIIKRYKFLGEIITSWSKIYFKHTHSEISNEILWHNTNIKQNNTLFYKDWYNKGIMYIQNIYDYRTKNFYTFHELKNLYNLNNGDFLNNYTLIGNIKDEWKETLKTENIDTATPEYLISTLLKNKAVNKMLYDKQIDAMRLTILKHTVKWENELNIRNIEWKKIFISPIKNTISTKLRAFQYKYLMRIIPNNSFLFACNLKPSNLCEFCNMNVDSNKHMFWECQTIQAFWSEIDEILKSKLN